MCRWITGKVLVADHNYLREFDPAPSAQIVAGYRDIMPTFEGQINEEQVLALIAFIQSLKPGETPQRVEDYPPPDKTQPTIARRKKNHDDQSWKPHNLRRFRPRACRRNLLNASRGFASWLLTKDHKRIALLYLISGHGDVFHRRVLHRRSCVSI